MSGLAGKVAMFWENNKILVVMGSILAGGHYGWKWMQFQEQFVPKGQEKDYPWFEIAKHVKEAQAAAAAAPAAAPAGGEK